MTMPDTAIPEQIEALKTELAQARRRVGRPIRLMEVCGTHTVALHRSGLRSMLPDGLELISGPGCPVCVTGQGYIDAAVALSRCEGITTATYGDMVRVPGHDGSLETARTRGADVRVVYSAKQAVELADKLSERQVVFLAIGFETTAPATAAAILDVRERGLENFSVLNAHKQVIPAMKALLEADDVPIDGFMCPGHVSVVIGSQAYRLIADAYGRPCVVAGFEPADMLEAIRRLVRQIRDGAARVENAYPVAVREEGNPVALRLIQRLFESDDALWRAMGTIPASGLRLRPAFSSFDGFARFGVTMGDDRDPPGCRCGEVIQGKVEPQDCPHFGRQCRPRSPVGPCMVSSEGTCAAWYKYHHTRPRRVRRRPVP